MTLEITVESNIDLIPSLLAAHALSGCNATARYYDIAKGTVVKQLKKGLQLLQLGDTESDSADTLQECSEFISSCYGSPTTNMTDCRIKTWRVKTGKARKIAPQLKYLPPTSESFELNVKRAHFQCAVWYETMDPHPPKLDPTYFGWEKNEKLKTLMPIGVPKDRKSAPDEVLKTIKCSCTSEKPCTTNRCSYSSSKLSCSIVCSYRGDSM